MNLKRPSSSLLLFWGIFTLLAGVFLYGAEGESEESREGYLGPCDLLLTADEANLFVLEADAGQLRRLRTDGSEGAEILPLAMKPRKMVFLPGEKEIAIVGSVVDPTAPNPDGSPRTGEPWESEGAISGEILFVSVPQGEDKMKNEPMTILQRIKIGHTPSGVAAGPKDSDGNVKIYVSDQFAETVTELSWPSGETLRTWPAGREPFSIAVTPDGNHLVVPNLLATDAADVSRSTACIRVIDTQTGEIHCIETLNGVTNLKEVALSPDGHYAFITGTIGNYETVPIQVVGGWIVENIFVVVDVWEHRMIDVIYLDDTVRGAANPWGIAVDPAGEFMALTASGTNEIIYLPFDRILKMLESRTSQSPGRGSYTYVSEKKGEVDLPIRLRVTLGLDGMRSLIVRGKTVWTAGTLEDTLGRVTLSLDPPYEFYHKDHRLRYPKRPNLLRPEEDRVDLPVDTPLHFLELESFSPMKGVEFKREFARLGPKKEPDSIRRGEILFHSALYCMEQWQSCITCHPDARVDGLNWDLTNDGVGNPKNTKNLLLAHETPPSMITGVRKDAETAVRAGVVHILFSRLPEEDYAAMDDYLRSLRPTPSPRLVEGRLSERARRGKILFESDRTGCADCHTPPLFTDLSLHKTGSQNYNDSHSKFDTPTLIETWRTAPYLNNGHELSIRDVLMNAKHGNQDGRLDALSETELDDLIEYILSL